MTSYASKEHFLQAQIESFANAKRMLKKYKNKIAEEILPDYRGDRDKVLEGIDKGLKYLEVERKKVKSELNNLIPPEIL